MYELVLTRDAAIEIYQGVFYTLLDADSYSMRDLYIQHPTPEGWWRSAGRIDDVVIFADAMKLNRSLLCSHREASSCRNSTDLRHRTLNVHDADSIDAVAKERLIREAPARRNVFELWASKRDRPHLGKIDQRAGSVDEGG